METGLNYMARESQESQREPLMHGQFHTSDNKRVADCDWEYLRTLRSLQEPHVGIPTLVDLLEYLALPEREHIWVYVEIKLHDDATTLVKGIADAISSVPPTASRPWNQRLIFGIGMATYLPPLAHYLPTYPISLLTPSLSYAKHFLDIPQIATFSVNRFLLMSSAGRNFVTNARKAGKAVYVWTVNKPRTMTWAIHNGLDGVVTDEVELYKRFRDDWERKEKQSPEAVADSKAQPLLGERVPSRVRFAVRILAALTNALGDLVAWKHRAILREFKSDPQSTIPPSPAPAPDSLPVPPHAPAATYAVTRRLSNAREEAEGGDFAKRSGSPDSQTRLRMSN
ncbi:hypothetical protein KEM55_000144 [Ascosphaera atra]|nr:hypothetical protein KEM55_000144 [Ascosphaera atra]